MSWPWLGYDVCNPYIVRQFRQDIYNSFVRGKDALFNTVDALMTETQAKSLPEVTQSLWFERHWASVYKAFEEGKIDQTSLQKVFTRYMPNTTVVNMVCDTFGRDRYISGDD